MSVSERFFIDRLAIVGVGLIGGSLALALKEAGCVGEVTGIGRGLPNLNLALELGVVDRICRDPEEGVRQADVVFLATPVMSIPDLARRLLPAMKPGAVLTDGGSVKRFIVEQIEPHLPAGVAFVPGHPIAGTEKSGAGAAFAGLYRDRRCILTPTGKTPAEATALIRRMWETAGSEVVLMDVDKHDRILAAISHLPHMIAYSLVNAVGSYDHFEENILEYSAGGFRDFTRIASSDPSMWRDIALSNREALLEMIERYESFLGELKRDIVAADGQKLFEFFLNSKTLRDAIL